ncbi:hypothetical protein NTB97_003220 [Salmonella enterica]|nr:hypothetical protein [Salmonella enterica]EEB5060330.1 hypothetical protein [Salmonella enterica]EKK4450635.1 hypothetical protein [Salmonella enterica]
MESSSNVASVIFTVNPIEAEVCQALALYKITLIKASYRNFWHRLSCTLGIKEALEHERLLIKQEIECRSVVNKSKAHQEMLEILINQQTSFSKQKDNFSHLMNITDH